MWIQLLGGVSTLAFAGLARFVTPLILKGWAKENILYTIASEMKGLVAVTGGKFHHAILASDEYHLNDPHKPWFISDFPKWEVIANDDPAVRKRFKDIETFDDRWPMIREFGGYWIGLPWYRSLYSYQFIWNEMGKDEDTGKPCIKSRNEETQFWYAMDFEYVVVIDDVQTSEGLPIRLEYLLTVRITNPRKALFETDNWLLRVEGAANRVAKKFAGTHPYSELRSEGSHDNTENEKENFSLPIIGLTDRLDDEPVAVPYKTGTRGRYGITIQAADFQSVVLVGDAAAQHEEVSLEVFTADQRQLARRKTADGNAYVTLTEGGAEADIIERKGVARAKEADSRLEAYAKEPELATTMMQTDAQTAPGAGKTVIFAEPVQRTLETVAKQLGLRSPQGESNS